MMMALNWKGKANKTDPKPAVSLERLGQILLTKQHNEMETVVYGQNVWVGTDEE